jgi:PhzF family phenazine biosynthesis protein
MGLPIVTVDAFTDTPFSGNPAAVCVLAPRQGEETEWMQRVAREMNLSETAFLRRRGVVQGTPSYDLRWFTPTVEVDLCGHATLASAHVLWEEGHVPSEEKLRFQTRSGVLTAERLAKDGEVWIELDFPAAPEGLFAGSRELLTEGLGVTPVYAGAYGSDYLAEVESEDVVRGLSPRLDLLKRLPVRGVAVTSAPSPATKAKGYDFVSRFFAPRVGVSEDPVTGSAHCYLGPFWGRRLGKEEVLGYQASARGGFVRVAMRGDRVLLGGKAITAMRGELTGLS